MQRSVIISVASLRKALRKNIAGVLIVPAYGKLTRLQIFDEITGGLNITFTGVELIRLKT